MARTNRSWRLEHRPGAAVAPDDLVLLETPVRDLADGEVLVRNLYLSLDPTNRLWMSDREQYLPPVGIGEIMRGSTIGVVEQSLSDRLAVGDLVMPSLGGWQLYTIDEAVRCRRVQKAPSVPLTAYLSVLGPTGITAYFGLMDICRPVAGETLVVSAAAGAVGSVVGQIAKIQGVRVVGIAGGETKCAWLRELGFDEAIDYKAGAIDIALDAALPKGADMLFENVGGPIMDAAFGRLNRNGRMALCGMIANYNDEGPMAGPRDFGRVLMNRLTIRGFIVIDYLPRAKEALAAISGWIADGRLHWKDHVIDGLEEAPFALDRLFSGDHDGKLVVRISDLG
ncbi:MAG: NADP-dependent oxidoreductase [Tabrizicola sp.]|nr:NADP-dependent oxidoreductase [Tabrizicola sp.]